jgi:hypothetical protein
LFSALVLTGCAPLSAASSYDPETANLHALPTQDWSAYEPAVGIFSSEGLCVHLCWLGINPGVTSSDEMLRVLDTSDQIDQNTLNPADSGIGVEWFTEATKTLRASAYLYVQEGVVQSISFEELAPWTIGALIGLLGEPDQITIRMETQGDVMYMPYALYFASEKVLASADSGDPGPHPNDSLVALKLNLAFEHESFQPWIGYGHLDVYLADQPVHAHPSGAGGSGP